MATRANTKKPHYADVGEVEKLAEKMNVAFLQCRELGHPWRPHMARFINRSYYERTLKCPRCKSLKRQYLSASGGIISSGYTYAEGYQFVNVGRVIGDGRDMIRLVSMLRTLDIIEVEEEE